MNIQTHCRTSTQIGVSLSLLLLLLSLLNCSIFVSSFIFPTHLSRPINSFFKTTPPTTTTTTTANNKSLLPHLKNPITSSRLFSEPASASGREELSVYLDPKLTEERTKSLFAWVCRAFAGDNEYNNLMLAMAAIFGLNLPPNSLPLQLVEKANLLFPENSEEQVMGEPIQRFEREEASLGAMGAGQWLGQFKTRPHALLDVRNMTHVDEWVQTLPRGCKRTLKKANAQKFTVVTKPIIGGEAAPHSSFSHFKCVVEHEVRLISSGIEGDVQGFFDALMEAVSRYIGTTQMTGVIQEYKNEEGKIIAFAHEVRKGKAIRGQWFYCTDEGSKKYVWFHSVQELVKRAIEAKGVETADLGPSGSDDFSALKAKYKFESVDDWPAIADYTGPFYYEGEEISEDNDERQRIMNLLRMLGR